MHGGDDGRGILAAEGEESHGLAVGHGSEGIMEKQQCRTCRDGTRERSDLPCVRREVGRTPVGPVPQPEMGEHLICTPDHCITLDELCAT